MIEHDRMNQLLSRVAARYGLGDLAFDGDGVCGLSFRGDTVLLTLSADGAWFSQSTALAPVPGDPDARLDLCERLLTINHRGVRTQGLVLSLDPEGDRVVAHLSVPTAAIADDEALRNLINFFLAGVERLDAVLWGEDDDRAAEPVTAPVGAITPLVLRG